MPLRECSSTDAGKAKSKGGTVSKEPTQRRQTRMAETVAQMKTLVHQSSICGDHLHPRPPSPDSRSVAEHLWQQACPQCTCAVPVRLWVHGRGPGLVSYSCCNGSINVLPCSRAQGPCRDWFRHFWHWFLVRLYMPRELTASALHLKKVAHASLACVSLAPGKSKDKILSCILI